jgi:hypothetical protein
VSELPVIDREGRPHGLLDIVDLVGLVSPEVPAVPAPGTAAAA